MKTALLNIDSTYTNIALEKVRMWHETQGDIVETYHRQNDSEYDKIYASSIFTFSDKSQIPKEDKRYILGGVGIFSGFKTPF